jgi:hypothetical protein
MNANFKSTYVSKNGNRVFVYLVNDDENKSFASSQEKAVYDEKTGQPLFFTTRYAGPKANLILSRSGQYRFDTSAIDKANSLIEQTGGALGQALAAKAAEHLIGDIFNAAPVNQEVSTPVATVEEGSRKKSNKSVDDLG